MSTRVERFDQRFADGGDPWGYLDKWYERRKRALALAMLPRERYAHGFEPACANGVFSVELAARCDRLLCADIAPRAVALAAQRLAAHAHVTVACRELPAQWPEGRFDLIVLGEFLYYLDADEQAAIRAAVDAALLPGGTLLCCHWRGALDQWPVPVHRVHGAFDALPGLVRSGAHEEREFLMDAWVRR